MLDLLGKELRYGKELLLNHYRKFVQKSEVAGHVGRVKTVVMNHLPVRKMFRSRIHKQWRTPKIFMVGVSFSDIG